MDAYKRTAITLRSKTTSLGEAERERSGTERGRARRFLLDFSPDGSWETMLNRCLEGQFGTYIYSFCYFDKIEQRDENGESTVLGFFHEWGGAAAKTGPLRGLLSGRNENVTTTSTSTNTSTTTSATALGPNTNSNSNPDSFTDTYTYGTTVEQKEEKGNFSETLELKYLLDEGRELAMFMWASGKAVAMPYIERTIQQTIGVIDRSIDAQTKSYLLETTENSLAKMGLHSLYEVMLRGLGGVFSMEDLYNVDKAGSRINNKDIKKHAYYSVQSYDEGTPCNSRPDQPRRATVHFECDSEEAIVDVTETELCTYELVVATPMACTGLMLNHIKSLMQEQGLQSFSDS